MFHQRRRDLIVPIRDRRQHRRIVTLPNFGKLILIAMIVFLAITIRNERRGVTKGEEYGRLYGREVSAAPKVQPVPVVREVAAMPSDETAADPLLVAPAAREQWLHDDATQSVAVASVAPLTSDPIAPRAGGARVAIVGGPEGVNVVQTSRAHPVLRGGFGR